MGRQARLKRQRQFERGLRLSGQQLRQEWLGKRVAFDAGRGDGVQQGMVAEVTEEGVISVVCLPEYSGRAVAVVLTPGYLDKLTLVDEQ